MHNKTNSELLQMARGLWRDRDLIAIADSGAVALAIELANRLEACEAECEEVRQIGVSYKSRFVNAQRDIRNEIAEIADMLNGTEHRLTEMYSHHALLIVKKGYNDDKQKNN